MVAPVFGAGCRKPDSDKASTVAGVSADVPADPVDLTEVRKAFESASPGLKLSVDETISAVRNRAFDVAIEQCQKLSKNPSLTPGQKQALENLVSKVRSLGASGVR